ncbi:MAG: YaiI/YqxD family protein [Hyphomicrobiales bacterium]|nr:YaiI/YqxD family protein [Hyphomicrobiales bacterium]MCP4998295.1 YaiI/YqxD family protein [Hyphomicrobiales bacterium]
MPEQPTIFVDADACPVKNEVLKVAERHGIAVTFVANGGLRPSRDPNVRNVVVSDGFDAADDWIVDHVGRLDVVITADILLAGRCVEKGTEALGPTGRLFDSSSIGMATAMRNLNQHLRESGEISGRNASFTKQDRSRFLQALDKLVLQKTREQPT